MLCLCSLYSSFIYGLLYLFLTAYPVIFQGVYGMKPGVSGLPELGVVIGCLCTGVVMIIRLPVYRRKLERNGNIPIPEWRLPEAMFGGIIFAGGIFWLGWAGYRNQVHWIVPTIGGAVAGFGISMVFLQAFNYLIDSYLMVRDRHPIRGTRANRQCSLRHQPSQPTPSCDHCLGEFSRYSLRTCLKEWELIGH